MTRQTIFQDGRATALLGLAAMAAAGCSAQGNAAPEAKARAMPVRVAAVEVRQLQDAVVVTGTLRPRLQVALPAEVPARVLRVLKDEGATVARGEVLAELDPTDYRLAHERANAALQLAEANRAHAEAEVARADNLKKTGGITEKDLLAARVAQQVAEASVRQAQAEAEIAAEQLGRTRIVAPFAGRVARRMADAGAMLSAGQPVFTLVDDAVLELRAAVPSAEWGRVVVGAPVEVTVDAQPGDPAHGKVVRVAPLVDERTRSFDAVIEVPRGEKLVGGLFARGVVRVGSIADALVVPPAALVRDSGRSDEAHVYVVADGTARRVKVRLGVEHADAVQVKDGLPEGASVVVDPPVGLTDGAPVAPAAARS